MKMSDVESQHGWISVQAQPGWRWYLGLGTPLFHMDGVKRWVPLYGAAVLYIGWLESGWEADGQTLHLGGFGFIVFVCLGGVLIMKGVWLRRSLMRNHRMSSEGCIWFAAASEHGLSVGLSDVEKITFAWNTISGIEMRDDHIRCHIGHQQLIIGKRADVADQLEEFARYARERVRREPST